MKREAKGRMAARDCETDVRLFTRFRKQKDRAAFETLARRWHKRAYRVALAVCRDRHLAMEAVQEAFLILLSPRVPFKAGGSDRFGSWFLTVVTNKARMTLRAETRAARKGRIDPVSFVRRKNLVDPGPGTQACEEKREAVSTALDRLEKRLREPLVMHFISGLQQKDVASRFGVSQQLISRRIAFGLRLLRERLDGAV
jgi:RNA polymerase sigma-70 factor (ECF subfamily)